MSEKVKVIVKNSVELSDLLEKLETQGYKWGSGDLPTKLVPFGDFPYVIHVPIVDKSILWGSTVCGDEISVKDYLSVKDDEEKTVKDDEENTVRIKRTDIHYAMADVIKEDDEIGKLFEEKPLLILVFGIIIEKIERKIFGEEGEE